MANYQANRGLQNVRYAVLRRDIKLLRREDKLFRHVFKDLRVGCELVHYENCLVLLIDMRQAVLNSIHSGHSGRDAMLGVVDEVWWPRINRQGGACAKTCGKCQKAGKNIRKIKRQKNWNSANSLPSLRSYGKWKSRKT